MEASHVHWNRLVAEIGEHLYYACRCGDARSHGIRNLPARKHHTALDTEWLAGADRPPQ